MSGRHDALLGWLMNCRQQLLSPEGNRTRTGSPVHTYMAHGHGLAPTATVGQAFQPLERRKVAYSSGSDPVGCGFAGFSKSSPE